MNHCCLELTSHCDTRYVWVFFINVWQSYVTVAVANLWCFILSVKEMLLESNTLLPIEFLSLFQRTCIFSTLCRLLRTLTWQLLSSHIKKAITSVTWSIVGSLTLMSIIYEFMTIIRHLGRANLNWNLTH